MLITSYNPAHLGDTLIAILGPDQSGNQIAKTIDQITEIKDSKSHETLGYNFFDISKRLPDLDGNGQVQLSQDQIDVLNQALHQAGFETALVLDNTPKLVVGHVLTCEPHPDSDHLSVTTVDVDSGSPEQIVCGANNIAKDQNVVVALSGAMMPDGKIIWPGSLRGVPSAGMICSARELGIPNAPTGHGILVLPGATPIGQAFDATTVKL